MLFQRILFKRFLDTENKTDISGQQSITFHIGMTGRLALSKASVYRILQRLERLPLSKSIALSKIKFKNTSEINTVIDVPSLCTVLGQLAGLFDDGLVEHPGNRGPVLSANIIPGRALEAIRNQLGKEFQRTHFVTWGFRCS